MHTLRRTPHRRWLIGLALCALVLAQALGLVHSVRHGGALGGAAVLSASDDGTPSFGHEGGGTECRLYDQFAHADLALPTPSEGLGLPTPDTWVAAPDTPVLAAGRWHAQARGPPRA
jgi:hypothetical protein